MNLGVGFAGIFSEPVINDDNDLRIELIRFLSKKDNNDIMNVITDEILSLCDLRIIKYKNDLKVKSIDLRLIILFNNFIEVNKDLYNYRFPNYILRYVVDRYQNYLKMEKSKMNCNFNTIPNVVNTTVNQSKTTNSNNISIEKLESKVNIPQKKNIVLEKTYESNVKQGTKNIHQGEKSESKAELFTKKTLFSESNVKQGTKNIHQGEKSESNVKQGTNKTSFSESKHSLKNKFDDNQQKWKRSNYPTKNRKQKNDNSLNNEKTNCLMIRNLNKKIGIDDIKKLIEEKKLTLSNQPYSISFPYNKLKKCRMNYVFITFCSEDETAKARKFLDGIHWNNCKLSVLNAKLNI